MTARLPDVQARVARDATFRTHDGVDLFYRHWPAVETPARGAIVLLHRGHEHSGRMAHLVDELAFPAFDFFAWDARGHGRSPGARGDSPSFGTSVRDLQTFVDHLRDDHGIAPGNVAIVAQSVGAVLAATWVHDYAPPIRAMVLASPAFKIKLYVPMAVPGLKLLRAVRGNFFVTSYVKAGLLTHDEQRAASYGADPLLSRAISVNVLLGLKEAADRIVADAQAITVPTQLIISGTDWVVHARPQHVFFDRLGSPVKERHVMHGFFHDTLGERDRARAVERVRAFIVRAYRTACVPPNLLEADQYGTTREEYDRLSASLPRWSLRGVYWRATRASLRVASPLADGLRLGRDTGFDSGSMLDYVYRNQARGRTVVGRWIDRMFLDSPGWRGIRERRQHVEALVHDAIRMLRGKGLPVHVLDIAAGPGRYVLDAIARMSDEVDSIVLRDYHAANVQQASALIGERRMESRARSERGDAYDRASLCAIQPRPTLAIVSGLYELEPANMPVLESLRGVAQAMPAGGLLVYTGQPWHPQLELIARALTSHRDGAAWVMRRRTQQELDQLVTAAGFRKVRELVGESGIFTVSLAERVAS